MALMGAMSLRWPSRRMERSWRGPITASSRSTRTPPIRRMRADAPAAVWSPRNTIQNTLVKTAIETHYGKRVNVEKQVKDTSREMDGRVYALDLSGDAWLASTSGGLFTSKDKGASLAGRPGDGLGELSLGCRAWSAAGRRPARRSGSLQRRRPDLDADRHSGDAHAHSLRRFLRGWNSVAGRARGRLLYARSGPDVAVGQPFSLERRGRPDL